MSKNIRNTVLSVMEGLITIKVKFNESDSKEYTYLALKQDGYKKDDYAVVQTPNDDYRIVKVTTVDEECDVDTQSNTEYKFVIARIDMDSFNDRNKQVDEAVAFFRKRQREIDRQSARVAMMESLGLNQGDVALLSFDKAGE